MSNPSFISPTAVLSELDAVNVVLRAQGLEKATSLENYGDDSDIDAALGFLSEADTEVQSYGWWFNKSYSLKLLRNDQSEVELPQGVLSVSNTLWASSVIPAPVVERAGKLFNTETQQFSLAGDITADIVVRLTFTDLPQVVRTYIATLAAHRAQVLTGKAIPEVARVTGDDVRRSLIRVEHEDDRNRQTNQVTQNVTLQGALNGWNGLRRNRQ